LKIPGGNQRKKLAGNLLLMAQAGQYNFKRSIITATRGGAACGNEFVNIAMNAIF
jgi:hypothetical protein